MTTAREKLYEEVLALVSSPAGPGADAEIRKIMVRYRVQTKPGVDVASGSTARDTLGDKLLALWRAPPPDVKAQLGGLIDEFRMQLKTSSGPAPASRPSVPQRARVPVANALVHNTVGARAASVPAVEDDDEPAPRVRPALPARDPAPPRAAAPVPAPVSAPSLRSRPVRASAEPVAGGPRKRGKTRGECPKCHSMGVVLAHSYSGDEYFSCIYCGWQAYKPVDEDDPNASLAVRLLGQGSNESSRE